MKLTFTILFLFIFQFSPGQNSINDQLFNTNRLNKKKIRTICSDSTIEKVISCIDQNLKMFIDTHYHYKTKQYIIIGSGDIAIRSLLSKKEGINRYLLASDTVVGNLWYNCNNDSAKFLKFLQYYFDLNLKYPNDLIPIDSLVCTTNCLNSNLNPKNILFYSSGLNMKLKILLRRYSKKEKDSICNIIDNTFDRFDKRKRAFNTSPIRITDIAFETSNTAYVGIDIYGRHFLWTLRVDNMEFTNSKSLWVY